jgi:transposase
MNRFQNPKQLMAYLGLIPSEHSSGKSIRRGSITKTGNGHVRRVLVEAAWTYHMPARVSTILQNVSRAYQKVSATYPGKPRRGYAPATAA